MSELSRSVRTPGAVLMGLGSIVGTGLFVSIALGAQIAGNAVVIAIFIAAIVAALNGLSSAQLAAAYPVSGGTYEYANRVLGSRFGFTAGWMFLTAKSASAATAALGSAGYLLYTFGIDAGPVLFVGLSLGILLLLTALVSGGISRSNTANKMIVGFTLFGLAVLVVAGFFVNGLPTEPISAAFEGLEIDSLLFASALMFVAYTGYGRIATLGEEVAEPRKTIPKAIVTAMIVIVLLYGIVTLTALQALGAEAFGQTLDGEAAPLMVVAQLLELPLIGLIVSLAAVTAMAGVLLNLVLGLSRVMLSMARRGDLPQKVAEINPVSKSPVMAVWLTGIIITLLVLSGDIRFTWSFSAFTVLIYYSITNLSAFLLPAERRLYPRIIPVLGFTGCLGLAFWIQPEIILLGIVFIALGLVWHEVVLRTGNRRVIG
ncbi:amino acid/polyamine/organocation transporter, APC superfamily [Cyclonatronum proteinivorum]|uniref:Amino acid/polyamine/organocation transporter, APC superfamily n=1 Tax=Cyclonatronum proteinivorum TaxID=1457365 RepID=A0A345UG77_9BACT|nr:APC family permease [Cyclonatronum proteinivorum]AXI99478.1 amino acid/polyamine/organocation transporter, APC superfamily [Cyclonatronum proteinivorum]